LPALGDEYEDAVHENPSMTASIFRSDDSQKKSPAVEAPGKFVGIGCEDESIL
jgi:hypothetical protein